MIELWTGNRLILTRKAGGGNMNYSLRIDDLVRNRNISANVPLVPDDISIAPENLTLNIINHWAAA